MNPRPILPQGSIRLDLRENNDGPSLCDLSCSHPLAETPMSAGYRDDMTMEDVMRMWPETIRIILSHGMLCVGCPFARFQTVNDAIREHGVDGHRFRKELHAVIGGDMPETN
jgi:hybrid cluster-associated redox disulfide protein